MKFLVLTLLPLLIACGKASEGSSGSNPVNPVAPTQPCVKDSYSITLENLSAFGTMQSGGGVTYDSNYTSLDHSYSPLTSHTVTIEACSVSRLLVALMNGNSLKVTVYKNAQVLDQRTLTGFIQFDYNLAGF